MQLITKIKRYNEGRENKIKKEKGIERFMNYKIKKIKRDI